MSFLLNLNHQQNNSLLSQITKLIHFFLNHGRTRIYIELFDCFNKYSFFINEKNYAMLVVVYIDFQTGCFPGKALQNLRKVLVC